MFRTTRTVVACHFYIELASDIWPVPKLDAATGVEVIMVGVLHSFRIGRVYITAGMIARRVVQCGLLENACNPPASTTDGLFLSATATMVVGHSREEHVLLGSVPPQVSSFSFSCRRRP